MNYEEEQRRLNYQKKSKVLGVTSQQPQAWKVLLSRESEGYNKITLLNLQMSGVIYVLCLKGVNMALEDKGNLYNLILGSFKTSISPILESCDHQVHLSFLR